MPEIKVSWPTLAAASTKAAGDGRSAQTDSFLCKKSFKKGSHKKHLRIRRTTFHIRRPAVMKNLWAKTETETFL